MKCKFCEAELCEEMTVCPACGKAQAEEENTVNEAELEEISVTEAPAEPEKKKSKVWKIVLAAAGMLVMVVVLTGAILYSMGYWDEVTYHVENTLHSMKFWRENDINYRKTYTVSDGKAKRKEDQVVATLGNQTLTNGELQAYYWMGVSDFINNYNSYLNYFGLDPYLPLDRQFVDYETGETFQQMFLTDALEQWRTYATLVEMALEANHTLSQEEQEYLDSYDAQMKLLAEESGYDSVQELIDAELFPGSSAESYYKYNYTSVMALTYYDSLYESLMPTDEELDDYYLQYEATLKNKGITKESGNYYNVRHILVPIEGGTKGEDGTVTYSDAEWDACRAKAQAMLDDFLAGDATKEAFAQLAAANSADPGSAQNGGLYEFLTKDYGFIEDFENWYLEEGRKPGDTGLVKNTQSSVQGYHIMYFESSVPMWEHETKTLALEDNTQKLMQEEKDKRPVQVDYTKIVLGYVDMNEE